MIEVLLFSLSISIDALGYSIGFGSKNVQIKLSQFLVLNLINSLILSLFLYCFSSFKYFFENPIIAQIGPILLGILGLLNVLNAFFSKFIEKIKDKIINYFKQKNNKNSNKVITKISTENNYLMPIDLLFLFLVFIFENAFSTFVFYTNFTNVILFVFSNFVFHFMFFLLGFNIGKKLAKKVEKHTSFVSGYIFLWLAFIELFL